MMKPVRILLTGIGGYGENYLKELLFETQKKAPQVVLEGIADPFAANSVYSEEIQSRKIPVYDTPEQFYQDHKADLAVISSPIHLHYPQVMTCLDHSCVLCEKPLCADLDQAAAIVRKEKETGRFVEVGYQLSFSRDVLALKKDILSGKFGKPVSMKALHAMRRGSVYYARNGWAGCISKNGCPVYDSPINNACAHQLHNMLYLLGEDGKAADPVSAEAVLWKAKPEIENFDAVVVRIQTEIGVPVLYYTAHCLKSKRIGPVSEYQFEHAVVSFGKNGVSEYEAVLEDGTVISYAGIDKGDRLQKFYDALTCLENGTMPACSAETAIPQMKCIEMIQKNPVYRVPREKLSVWEEEKEGVFYSIPTLEKAFEGWYARAELPQSPEEIFLCHR